MYSIYMHNYVNTKLLTCARHTKIIIRQYSYMVNVINPPLNFDYNIVDDVIERHIPQSTGIMTMQVLACTSGLKNAWLELLHAFTLYAYTAI